jgi:hypothetical protein
MQEDIEVPIEDSLYWDALLSIVAGDSVKALLEAGVAVEVALTKLLVDVSTSLLLTPSKNRFIKKARPRINRDICRPRKYAKLARRGT